ncbi:MAG: 50S ribosomal protein L30e [Candidatus Hadarchaeales archaeon]
MSVSEELGKAAKSGKLIFGTRKSVKALKNGLAKAVVVAANCPEKIFLDIKHYTKIAKIPLHVFEGDSRGLGIACGKPFTINVVTVVEEGDSNILSAVKGK